MASELEQSPPARQFAGRLVVVAVVQFAMGVFQAALAGRSGQG